MTGPTPEDATGAGRGWSRRRLLLAGAGGAATFGAGVGLGRGGDRGTELADAVAQVRAQELAQRADFVGAGAEPFHGPHQAGVSTPVQAHGVFCAFDLRPEVDVRRLQQLLQLLTDDLRRITAGRPALGDTAPELAATPARLTVTVGLGPSAFDRVGLAAAQPTGLMELPAFTVVDQLEERYCGGDLLLQICADDPLVVAHAHRMLFKDVRAFATSRWVQRGFQRARGNGAGSTTPRNLMGQVDGTVNPRADAELDRVVWHAGDDWFAGGTTLVLRRIRMELDTWDELDPSAMEAVIGRRLADGAPLGGRGEHDPVDFTATDATGLPAIADFSHIRVARGAGPELQVLRRGFNYDDTPSPTGGSDVGQLFCSYQADIGTQFVPMQHRVAANDLLNQWTVPTGSAVFAILPGCAPDGYLGEGLFA